MNDRLRLAAVVESNERVLSRGRFHDADFRGSKLDGVNWTGAAIDGAKFDSPIDV
jgi:hypothetical protein